MKARVGRSEITVTEPRLARSADGRWRMSARVGENEVHVTCDERPETGVDAFLSAFLLPAAKAGATLRLDGDCDAELHGNFDRIQAIARRYWGFPGGSVAVRRLLTRRPVGETAMFFTGGVDSFFTLQQRRASLARLIFVDGFDLGLEDRARFAPVRAAIEEIARETGLRAEFPRTNLRHDPTFATLGWGTTFGAALAAVGHAMAPAVSRIHIASSTIREDWGSTPDLDPLWSSGAVAFVHDGAETTKFEKAKAIADWPLAQRFLRVCFAPQRDGFNCGACEKCVRTQAIFATVGRLDRLTTFPPAPLLERIDGVPYVPPVNRFGWEYMRDSIGDARLSAAIDRMLARRAGIRERARESARRWLDRLPGGGVIRRLARLAMPR